MNRYPKSLHSREYIRQTIDSLTQLIWRNELEGELDSVSKDGGFLHNGDPSYHVRYVILTTLSPTLLKFVGGCVITISLPSNHLKVKI